MVRTGQKYKQKGYSPNHPVVIIPGLCSSAMKVVESPHKDWIDRRIWLDITTIGFGKVWDQMSIKKKKKRKKTSASDSNIIPFDDDVSKESDIIVTPTTQEEDQNRRRWIAHMVLQNDGLTDPPGIKLRPIETIHGIMYLDPGAITNALSYVFGPLIETLWDIGYTDTNLRAAPYDWRIPPSFLEFRDGYFSKLKEKIDDMFEQNENKKVVLVAHSLGTRCVHYFLRFCERTFSREWISERIHTWIPVGPLWLGAPKSVRATTSGERMGLDAFLFEEEGILLSRCTGSSGWMFPYIVPDYEFTGYVYRKSSAGHWISQSLEETFEESDISHIWKAYCGNYLNDPCFGPQEEQLKAPPIDKMYVIYGINLKTEIFYFYKPSNGLTKLELDPAGEMENFVCHGGIAYETKNTRQNKLRGRKRGGDGTVPYASLSYCTHWKKDIEVIVEELEGAEHREILKDKTFTRLIVEYNCHAPPPPQLPNTFKNLVYELNEIRDNKQAKRKMTLTHKGVQVHNKNNNTVYHKKYSAIKHVEEISQDFFSLEFIKSSSVYVYKSTKFREIIQELNVRIKFIEYSRPSAEEAIDEQGQTELHRSVKENDIVSVRELLSDDRNVNAQDNHGWTPLHIATQSNYIDIILLLLKHPKIDVNLQTKDSTSSLMYALRNEEEGSESVWNAFKESGANINIRGTDECTPLHETTMRKNIKGTKWLIKEFANVNAKNAKGDTPLHYAIQHNDKELISLLLEQGADRHIPNRRQKTPIHLAQQISSELWTFLRDYKVSGYRARAIHKYVADVPEELSLEYGERINNITIKCDYGDGWWHGECNGKSGYFPSNYVKVSEQIRDASRPPLGAPEPEDGPDDVRDEYGQTPLHKAAFEDRCDTVFQLLLNDKTNINAQDRNGWTPAHCAASQGSLEVLLVLLQKPKLDLSKRNTDGSTAFHYAVRIKGTDDLSKKKIAQILDGFIQLVDIDILGKGGETPLHQAVLRLNSFVVKYLLEHGADANALNDSNAGPLFFAVGNRDVECVKLLLLHNANPTVKSKRGSPLEAAVATNSSSILQLLEDNKPSATNSIPNAKPLLPVRKRSIHLTGPARPYIDPNKRIFMPQPTVEDISDGDSTADDFESLDSSEDSKHSVFDEFVRTQFSDDLQLFEREAYQYILEKLYKGNAVEMRSNVTSITRGRPVTPVRGARASFIGASPRRLHGSSSEFSSNIPTTATETADALLANKRKKKAFFGKKKLDKSLSH